MTTYRSHPGPGDPDACSYCGSKETILIASLTAKGRWWCINQVSCMNRVRAASVGLPHPPILDVRLSRSVRPPV